MATARTRHRIGVIGLHHDHIWTILAGLAACENAELVAVADPHPPLLYKARRLYECNTYESYDDLLERESLDAVFVYAANRIGSQYAIRACQRKLHVLVEKPMAASGADAAAMYDAAKENGVRLMVNWPFAWWAQLQHALKLASEQKRIGTIFQVNYRAAHEGVVEMGHSHYFAQWVEDPQQSGGGALMDYCCYGALLARVLLGMPERVSGLWGNYCKDYLSVEDNAVMLLSYPRAMAIAQASWTQHGKLGAYTPTFFGDRGTMLVEPRDGGRLLLADDDHPKGEVLEVPVPEPHLRSAAAHFFWAIDNEQPFTALCDPAHCRDVNIILDAGIRSAGQDSRLVPLADRK